MRPLQEGNGRLWLKTVISCQAAGLPRITVYLFGVGRGRCLLARPFGAEAVISHPSPHSPQGPKEGPPGQAGDNRLADGMTTLPKGMTDQLSPRRESMAGFFPVAVEFGRNIPKMLPRQEKTAANFHVSEEESAVLASGKGPNENNLQNSLKKHYLCPPNRWWM